MTLASHETCTPIWACVLTIGRNRNSPFFDNLSGEPVEIAYDDARSSVSTPKVGLTYEALPNLRLRSVYATGFRAPGAYSICTMPPPWAPPFVSATRS